jgi:hypothetical protein
MPSRALAAAFALGLFGSIMLTSPAPILAAPQDATSQQSTPLVGPPTDKDQCKKDGWQQFNNPTFKNQGACVSYVNALGGAPGDGDPVSFSETPELSSVALFGSGAFSLGAYALMRARAQGRR